MCRHSAGRVSQSTQALEQFTIVGEGRGSLTKAPAATPISPGKQPVRQATVVPQAWQNDLTCGASTAGRYSLSAPVGPFTCPSGKYADQPNALPVRRRQSSQWQVATRLGSPLTSMIVEPQQHWLARIIRAPGKLAGYTYRQMLASLIAGVRRVTNLQVGGSALDPLRTFAR